jgi:hypothetical protein
MMTQHSLVAFVASTIAACLGLVGCDNSGTHTSNPRNRGLGQDRVHSPPSGGLRSCALGVPATV